MPAEVILEVFHKICLSANQSCWADLLNYALTSKTLYAIFKENEYAIFRRAVKASLPVTMGDEGADMVIKMGCLHARKPWPTDPGELDAVLRGIGVVDARGMCRTSEMMAVVLGWVRGAMAPPSHPSFKVHKSWLLDRMAWTERLGLPMPDKWVVVHPYECYGWMRFLRVPREGHTAKMLAGVVTTQLHSYWDHVSRTMSPVEAARRGSAGYVPCCLLKVCASRDGKPASPPPTSREGFKRKIESMVIEGLILVPGPNEGESTPWRD
jgi:hypothetical protein